MRYQTRPAQRRNAQPAVQVEAIQWFKNGDHPLDGPADREGRVVRYFRHPRVPGTWPCGRCDHIMHDHGWIDKGYGITICPGMWVVGITEYQRCGDMAFRAMFELVLTK